MEFLRVGLSDRASIAALATRPPVLDDDSMVPPELRPGVRPLRNAGLPSPELELRGIARVEQLPAMTDCRRERRRAAAAQLELPCARIARSEARGGSLMDDPACQARALDRPGRAQAHGPRPQAAGCVSSPVSSGSSPSRVAACLSAESRSAWRSTSRTSRSTPSRASTLTTGRDSPTISTT